MFREMLARIEQAGEPRHGHGDAFEWVDGHGASENVGFGVAVGRGRGYGRESHFVLAIDDEPVEV